MAAITQVPGVRKNVLYGGKGPPPQFLKNSKVKDKSDKSFN